MINYIHSSSSCKSYPFDNPSEKVDQKPERLQFHVCDFLFFNSFFSHFCRASNLRPLITNFTRHFDTEILFDSPYREEIKIRLYSRGEKRGRQNEKGQKTLQRSADGDYWVGGIFNSID